MKDPYAMLEAAARLGVRGRVGAYIVQWNAEAKRVVVYLYVPSSVAPSPAQIQVRNAMRTAMSEFSEMGENEREDLQERGDKIGLTNSAYYAHLRIPQLV